MEPRVRRYEENRNAVDMFIRVFANADLEKDQKSLLVEMISEVYPTCWGVPTELYRKIEDLMKKMNE